MVIIGVELFQKSYATPSTTKNDQLGLVAHLLRFFSIFVIDEYFGDRQVLGTASTRLKG